MTADSVWCWPRTGQPWCGRQGVSRRFSRAWQTWRNHSRKSERPAPPACRPSCRVWLPPNVSGFSPSMFRRKWLGLRGCRRPTVWTSARRCYAFGIDSLMSVELRNSLSASVGRSLDATIVYDHPSVSALAEFLGVLLSASGAPTPGPGESQHAGNRPSTAGCRRSPRKWRRRTPPNFLTAWATCLMTTSKRC